jgi:hypothetical protein
MADHEVLTAPAPHRWTFDDLRRADRNTTKASLPAWHGIALYWVANVISRQVEVFREPVVDSTRKLGCWFNSIKIFNFQDRLVPLCKPDVSLQVTVLLS